LLTLAFVFAAACSDNPPPTEPSAAAGGERASTQAPPAATTEAAPAAGGAPSESAALERIDLAQAGPAAADLSASGYEIGVHYQRLSPTQPTSSSPDQVEVAEFFMYSCVHCYNFEPHVQQWLMTKPAYVNFVRVPTVWNPLVKLHAQAFYAAEALGKGEEMHTPFFREMHVTGNYLETEAAIASFFARFGVDAAAFKRAFDSFAVHTKLQRADELTRRYRISGTPTVVVNGKYVTSASMAGGYEQLMDLINMLAASERTQN
jgi:thiol:disulfide interchange protein DsbA